MEVTSRIAKGRATVKAANAVAATAILLRKPIVVLFFWKDWILRRIVFGVGFAWSSQQSCRLRYGGRVVRSLRVNREESVLCFGVWPREGMQNAERQAHEMLWSQRE